jgi:replicative DNA helicase
MTLPPHSPESEAALMGCLLLDPNCLDAVVQAGLQSDWLYDGKHRTLLEAIGSLMDQGKAVDAVTVARWLVDSGRSHEIGLADLSTLMDSTPSATNWPHYLEPIKACFIRRSIIRACQDVLSDAASGQCSPDQLISSAESAIDRCRVGVVDTDLGVNLTFLSMLLVMLDGDVTEFFLAGKTGTFSCSIESRRLK